jgi:hypothetical protein
METTYMGGKPRIDKPRGLSAIDFIIKGAMEKCVFDIKLIDGSGVAPPGSGLDKYQIFV